MTMPDTEAVPAHGQGEYITVAITDQLFGLPILEVQDVFMPERITRVPLAARDVTGVMNLRGRLVTVIDMRRRLCLPPLEADAPRMAVGIEWKGESYGLIVDRVGEVLRLSGETFEPTPANLDPRWAGVSAGVHRLEDALMVVVDVKKVLAADKAGIAA